MLAKKISPESEGAFAMARLRSATPVPRYAAV